LRYRHLLVEGAYILIFGRVDTNTRNNRMEVRVKSMVLLGEALDKFCKTVSLYIDLEDLNEMLIHDLHKAFTAHPGECEVKLKVRDSEDGLALDMYPKKFRVSPSAFIRAVNMLEQIEFRLNGFQPNM
jgi:DNA polymerase-3 subunit alpha